jgi:hypothetical protein
MSGSAELVEDSESLFKKVNAGLKPILGDDSSLYDNDGVYATISLIEQCAERVEKEHLMSKNEQLEDILTSTMKVCAVADHFRPLLHLSRLLAVILPFPHAVPVPPLLHGEVLPEPARYGRPVS